VQCDVFDDEMHADTDALEEVKTSTSDVNLNDHQSVFQAVYKKVNYCLMVLSALLSL